MVRQKFYLHYRLVSKALTVLLTLGAAGILGYLILLVRL
jgi:hypothetical protein